MMKPTLDHGRRPMSSAQKEKAERIIAGLSARNAFAQIYYLSF
jgi:hypothetical protein